MTSTQAPIDSGFGMRSEPADNLDGVDLIGKRVVITGGYSGLGLETTRALAGPVRRSSRPRGVRIMLVRCSPTRGSTASMSPNSTSRTFPVSKRSRTPNWPMAR